MREKTRVAYRCSYCASVISADISDAMLSKGFKFECPECKKTYFEMNYTADNSTVNFLVPCLMCPHPHPYKVSKDMFFSRDIYCLSCSFSGLDICFFGETDNVEDEIDRTSAEISELMLIGKDDNQKKRANMMVADTSVIREVLFAIGNLDQDKKISCKCGSKSIKAIVDYDKVTIVCKVCNAKTDVPARNKFDANNAIELEEIRILPN